MKIEKGIVKYKDRSDIICTYGTTDDGTKYYFLDENDTKKFSNGNRIVSSLLVEAIDPMVKATKVGVIDNSGVVVIPCVNRSIRVVDDGTILVEVSNPISQSVIDAVELRNDPLSAAKLVSTPATIKDKINQQMGTEGKYLFNDQFSEATVCDIDGNNLVDGEYYSFIAQANGKLYMSKNTADSEIKEYVLTINNEDALDVSDVSVDQNVVEDALAATNPDLDAIVPSINDDIESDSDVMSIDGIGGLPLDAVLDEDSDEMVPDFATSADVEESPVAVESDDESKDDAGNINEGFDAVDLSALGVDTDDDSEQDKSDESEDSKDDVVPPILPSVDVDLSDDVPELPGIDTSEESNTMVLPTLAEDSSEESKEDTVTTDIPALPAEEDNTVNIFEDKPVTDIFASPAPVTIDPETVASTVDKDGNGINDSEETMVNGGNVPASTELDVQKTDSNAYADTINSSFAMATSSLDSNLPMNTVAVQSQVSNPIDRMDYLNSSISGTSVYGGPIDSYGSRDYSMSSRDINLDSLFTNVQPDRISHGEGKDNIMTDVVRSMSELMRQNKEQRSALVQYQDRLDSVESQRRLLAEQYKQQTARVEAMAGKLRSLEENTSRLEARSQMYESRIRDQEKIIASQERELRSIRPQLEGKQDLVKLLADAKALLGSDSDYSYEDNNNYYRRVA